MVPVSTQFKAIWLQTNKTYFVSTLYEQTFIIIMYLYKMFNVSIHSCEAGVQHDVSHSE